MVISSISVGITQLFQNCQRKDNLLSLAYLYGKGLNVLSYLEQTELYLWFFIKPLVFSTYWQLNSQPCPSTSLVTFLAQKHHSMRFWFHISCFWFSTTLLLLIHQPGVLHVDNNLFPTNLCFIFRFKRCWFSLGLVLVFNSIWYTLCFLFVCF